MLVFGLTVHIYGGNELDLIILVVEDDTGVQRVRRILYIGKLIELSLTV